MGIAGYDDISFSRIATPRLTTIHQDVEKKAQLSVQLLMKKIQGEELAGEGDVKLPVTLVVRKSTKNQN